MIEPLTLLTDEVQACVGATAVYTAPEELGKASIRAFALAIGSDPDRWSDAAPPTLIFETCQLTGLSERDVSGYLGHDWGLPLPVPCTMIRGGNDYRISRPARPEDVITTSWEITRIRERHDAEGVPLLIVVAEAVYAAADGGQIASNTETLIYRPMKSSP
ncbi:MAG: MaoC family dehydratase N-terminal domain-containing protein [Acidimicrobiales bacterium]|nr:MaoC family dehydratase N-terminal domain-containing protein [Acidimicrobiales bacterium]